LREVLIYDANN